MQLIIHKYLFLLTKNSSIYLNSSFYTLLKRNFFFSNSYNISINIS